MPRFSCLTLVATSTLLLPPVAAQEAPAETAPPRAPKAEDYGQWETLRSPGSLSQDGRWIAYSVNRVDRKNEVRLGSLAGHDKGVRRIPYGSGPRFSADGHWFGVTVGVSEEDREKAQKAGKPARNKLLLCDLVKGEDHEIEGVTSFSFSGDGRHLVARRAGSDVIVRDLTTGTDTTFGNVASHAWSDVGSLLALVIGTDDKVGNGIQLFDAAAGILRTLDSAATDYKSLTWRADAADLAILRSKKQDDEDAEESLEVVTFRGLDTGWPDRKVWDHASDESLAGFRVVDFSGVRWSDDGELVFFGIKETEAPAPAGEQIEADAEETKDDETKGKTLKDTLQKEAAHVDVWHPKDIFINPQQQKTASRDERTSFLTALWIDEGRAVSLANDLTESVTLVPGQRHAIGRDNTPYERVQMFGPVLNDIYVIDVTTGERKLILEGLKMFQGTSSDGALALYVKDDHLWTYDLESEVHTNITTNIDAFFINQESDNLTAEKPPYGVAGWTSDGEHILLNDRYDVWKVWLDGSGGERITAGAEERVRHRMYRMGGGGGRGGRGGRGGGGGAQEGVDMTKPQLLTLYGDFTKQSGYASLEPDGRVEQLRYIDRNVGGLTKAENTEVYAWVEQSYEDSPDVFVGDSGLTNPRQISETNPFQKDFLWGFGELVDYQSERGVPLQGALYYPAGFEEGKQYPMIVLIYEKRSQNLHSYSAPSEESPYNPAVFTSEGYFVLQPDIVYQPQNPGLSAVECVVPAVKAALGIGSIDENRVGLVGHSWGAYQTSFIVTQTDIFAAGVAGAPLTDMMSMSMFVYWNSGGTNARIFWESQGRMNQPFWRDVDTYIANSPVFHIDNLNTPLLMTFGDQDGAVDWHQGVEMYNAARVADKPVVMLVYPGENHSLARKPNKIDYHYRVRAWFDHYLKGVPAESWITDGVTHLDREKELEALKKDPKKKITPPDGSGGNGAGNSRRGRGRRGGR